MNVIQGVERKFNVRGNKSGGFQVFVEDSSLRCSDILSGEKSQISFEGELREILNQTIFDDQILKYFDQIHVFPFTDKIPSYFWENKLSQKIVKDGNPELILEAIKYCKNHNNLEILFQGLLNEHFSEEEIISTWSYLQQILSKEKDILFQFEMKLCKAVSLYGSDNMIDRILAIGVDKRAKLYLIKNKNYRYYGGGIKS